MRFASALTRPSHQTRSDHLILNMWPDEASAFRRPARCAISHHRRLEVAPAAGANARELRGFRPMLRPHREPASCTARRLRPTRRTKGQGTAVGSGHRSGRPGACTLPRARSLILFGVAKLAELFDWSRLHLTSPRCSATGPAPRPGLLIAGKTRRAAVHRPRRARPGPARGHPAPRRPRRVDRRPRVLSVVAAVSRRPRQAGRARRPFAVFAGLLVAPYVLGAQRAGPAPDAPRLPVQAPAPHGTRADLPLPSPDVTRQDLPVRRPEVTRQDLPVRNSDLTRQDLPVRKRGDRPAEAGRGSGSEVSPPGERRRSSCRARPR